VTATWAAVALVGLATMTIKAAGTLLVGGRTLPPRVQAAMEHLAPALLAALLVVTVAAATAAIARALG